MCDAGDRGCEDGVDTVVLTEVKYAKKNLIVEMEMDSEYEQAIDDLISEERLSLAHLKYDEQLKLKSERSLELFNDLKDEMSAANIESARNLEASQVMQPIRYGNVKRSCYNTYNFAIGYDVDGNVNVGLIKKHSSTTTNSFVDSVDSYSHISAHVKRIVRAFKKFIVESGQQPFNEFNHTGVWRSLTILECIGDVSMVADIVAMENLECEENLKKSFSDRFLRDDNFTDADSQFQVLSVYWKRTTIEDCKRTITLEHIGGLPYIYERYEGNRFRITPSALGYFPTNRYATAALLQTIAKKSGISAMITRQVDDTTGDSNVTTVDDAESVLLAKQESVIAEGLEESITEESISEVCLGESMDEKALEEDECHDEGQQAIAAKRRKSDNRNGEENVGEENEDESNYTGKGTVIVNLGCGIGHIGIHLMVLLRKSRLTTDQKRFLFGCDVKKVVVELAGSNAFENNIIENDYKFVDAKVEDVMPNLRAYLPKWSTSNQVNIIGVLNCRHTEISESVIAECRAFNAMRKLIYVTSEASKSFANLLALCASSTLSNGNRSEAFQLTSITPVDSHPHTDCFEWIIELNRNGCTA